MRELFIRAYDSLYISSIFGWRGWAIFLALYGIEESNLGRLDGKRERYLRAIRILLVVLTISSFDRSSTLPRVIQLC